jgi:hypothetical protein
MKFNHDNPLELLFVGPLDETQLAEAGVKLMPDSNYWEMLEQILYLVNQYREDPQKVLTPHWWEGDAEKFRDEMNEELERFWSDDTDEEKQLIALEILLNMWSRFLFG